MEWCLIVWAMGVMFGRAKPGGCLAFKGRGGLEMAWGHRGQIGFTAAGFVGRLVSLSTNQAHLDDFGK
jgi:hypothetical protein